MNCFFGGDPGSFTNNSSFSSEIVDYNWLEYCYDKQASCYYTSLSFHSMCIIIYFFRYLNTMIYNKISNDICLSTYSKEF